jgi:two-component system response regulator RegA
VWGAEPVAEAVEVQPSFCLDAPSPEKTLLLLDDDTVLCRRLNHVFDALGFIITTVGTVEKAVEFVRVSPPAFAVLAQRLKDGSGLTVMKALREERPDARIVMLTSYGNIATAVLAIRGGAVDYLMKPATDDDVVRAVLGGLTQDAATPPERPASAKRVRWDHIQQMFELYDRNISETARRLGMHRRTLQRTLIRNAPR